MKHCRKTLCNAVGVLSIGQGLLCSCGESYIPFPFLPVLVFCGFVGEFEVVLAWTAASGFR